MGTPWIVVPDTHGQLAMLEKLINQLEQQKVLDSHRLIFLGDYIDRGPDSKGLIALALDLSHQGHIFLCGNHEYTLIKAMDGDLKWVKRWDEKYESRTCQSYGLDTRRMSSAEKAAALRSTIPSSHLNFIRELPWYYETDQEVFVHAGLEENESWASQRKCLAERWNEHWEHHPRGPSQLFSRELAMSNSNPTGKRLMTGHVALVEPKITPDRIMLDCGAGEGGSLVAWTKNRLWRI
jgi:hypothetical protein